MCVCVCGGGGGGGTRPPPSLIMQKCVLQRLISCRGLIARFR